MGARQGKQQAVATKLEEFPENFQMPGQILDKLRR